MIRRARPILFVLGPAGSGKTTLGRSLAASGFQHIDLDAPAPSRVPEPGLDKLRWGLEVLAERARIGPLALALESLDGRHRHRGTVLTFTSKATLPPRHAAAVERAGIDLVVLYASGADCLEGCLARERSAGRVMPTAHWIEHNASSYAQLSLPHLAPHRVPSYRDGRFIGAKALFAAVVSNLAARNPQWRTLGLPLEATGVESGRTERPYDVAIGPASARRH
jgi:hypothetical protein